MDKKSRTSNRGVTFRAIILALFLIPIDNVWITIIEVRWYGLDGTCLPLFITPIFILFLLALANIGVRRLRPQSALTKGELLTVYMMIVMGATLASHDLLQNLFGAIGHPYHYADEVNNYQNLFFRYLPDSLLVKDKTALDGFYRGGVYPWTWDILKHWIGPLAWWSALLLVLISMMMCLNIIIRKRWTEHEKLTFPLIQLPLEMASEQTVRFYGNPLMWAGFALAFGIGLLNGLHWLYPSVPFVEGVKQYNIGAFFTQPPWNAVQRGGFQIAAYPFTIGLTYFMPLDLSFSCWFFYLARKFVQVIGRMMGWDTGSASAFPYYESQSSGAWLALGAAIILASRSYLKGVWKQAWHEPGESPEAAAESRLYRQAFVGLLIGAMLLLAFSQYIGMAAWVAIIFFGIYFVLSIAMTRVRAELGTPHEIYYVNPQQIMLNVFGYNMLGPANLTILSTMYWFNRCYRSHPMPNQLESLKMAEGTSVKLRPLIFALMLAVVVGMVSTYYANLNLCYLDGAEAKCSGFKWWLGTESFDKLRDWMNNRPRPEPTKLMYMVVGALMVAGLTTMRGAFVGWPFHPAGYALAVSFAIDYFWFAMLVSWLVKFIIIRYGGMKLHHKLVPFFLGLILGDFFIGSIWAILGPLMGQRTYRIFI